MTTMLSGTGAGTRRARSTPAPAPRAGTAPLYALHASPPASQLSVTPATVTLTSPDLDRARVLGLVVREGIARHTYDRLIARLCRWLTTAAPTLDCPRTLPGHGDGTGQTIICLPGPARLPADLRPRLLAWLKTFMESPTTGSLIIERVIASLTPYLLASTAASSTPSRVQVGEVVVGGGDPVVIAGPCSVESEAQIVEAAHHAREAGAHLLRGGAFKPRTSPYSFQGLGLPGLQLLARAGAAVGLPIVTEVLESALVPAVAALADVLQIGARNMQNAPLLRAAGRVGRPVLLKAGSGGHHRGMAAGGGIHPG